jgi:hypothetical protein
MPIESLRLECVELGREVAKWIAAHCHVFVGL